MSKRKSMKDRLADQPATPTTKQPTAAPPAAPSERLVRDDLSPFPSKGRSAAVSFRSSPELFEALVQIAAQRKPARKHPYTQQDILCVALAEWLERHDAWPPGE